MPERRKKTAFKKLTVPTRRKIRKPKVSVKAATVKKPSNAAAKKAPHDGSISVFDLNGKSVEKIMLDPLFEGEANRDIIYQAVLMYQAGQREGTAATKTRGEVSGGGKKPWKQKGTGRARHASIRSPLWRGGGVTFGPHPRDYSFSLPSQLKRKAVAEGVKDKVTSGKLFMLDRLELDQPKTKIMAGVLGVFKLQKPLVVVDKKSDNLLLASRNLRGISVKTADEVNALDMVSHQECLMTQSAYKGLLKRLKS